MTPKSVPPSHERLKSSPRKGLFISFEGLDGSGKSTQARRLYGTLGPGAVLLKEPSEGPFGRAIRKTAETARHRPLLEHRLFIQDREWDLRHNILPALGAGKTVILDRYIVSNIAYQGALGIPPESVMRDNLGFPWPDLTVMLRVDAPTALKRINRSRKRAELFEDGAYLEKVSAILDSMDIQGVLSLDGTLPEDRLADEIARAVSRLIQKA